MYSNQAGTRTKVLDSEPNTRPSLTLLFSLLLIHDQLQMEHAKPARLLFAVKGSGVGGNTDADACRTEVQNQTPASLILAPMVCESLSARVLARESRKDRCTYSESALTVE